jgi:SAM-dependent methyltransferase
MTSSSQDYDTAAAFAHSWNHTFSASPYTDDQVREWLAPLNSDGMAGKTVLELGCGSGGLLQYVARQQIHAAVGMDLGDSVRRASRNLSAYDHVRIVRDDIIDPHPLQEYPFDIVYCIGVLHHLKNPDRGFSSVLSHTAPGGRFHCWVYAKEGNGLVRWIVEPLRRLTSRLPWRVNKYLVALPLTIPFYFYSKACSRLHSLGGLMSPARLLPLYAYMKWISKRGFRFHHHVAFDQLVSPQTRFFSKAEVDAWLADPRIDPASTYVIHRNGNGWKFGGRIKQ